MENQRAESSPADSTVSETRILELEQELAACRKTCLSLDSQRAHFELFTDSIPDHAFVALDAEAESSAGTVGQSGSWGGRLKRF